MFRRRARTSSPRRSGLNRRLLLTLSTAAALSVLYLGYSAAVTPLLRTPRSAAPRAKTVINTAPLRQSVRLAEEHLPAQDWTAAAKYSLQTDRAWVFFNTWDPVEDDRSILFEPFAVIFTADEEKPDEAPITIVSEAAYVKFEKDFSITNPSPGRVVGGALQGAVRITGPDGLVMDGRNFFFSEDARRVFSDSQVQFVYGPHSGQALGVQIELIPDENPPEKASLAVLGIESVRLRKDVALNLEADSADLFAGDNATVASPEFASEPEKKTGPPRIVRVRSDGSFEFTVATNIATFEDNVRIYNPTEAGQYDVLQCDRLAMLFEPDPAKQGNVDWNVARDNPTPADGKRKRFIMPDRHLIFRRMGAQGDDANQSDVVLTSQTNGLTARMTKLVYDASTRVAVLTDPQGVRVSQRASNITSPEITLVQGEKNKLESVVCRGPGRLLHYNKVTGVLEASAVWKKELRRYPDAKSPLDIIELDSEAVVRQPEQQATLAADFIRMWIRPQPPEEGTVKKKPDEQSFQPDRMLGVGNVVMHNPQMHTKTERLEVWFEQAPVDAKPSAAAPNRSGSSQRAEDDSNPFAFASRKSTGDKAGAQSKKDEQKPAEPINVNADLIRLRIIQGKTEEDTQVAEIWTEGDVQVLQPVKENEQPLSISGSQLHVENKSETSQILHVYGQPAAVRTGQMRIEGGNVHLDRRGNHAWVEGPGSLALPVEKDMEGKPLAKPQVLNVQWVESMDFDGKLAEFLGNVKSESGAHVVRCQEMQVTMTERLSFIEPPEKQEVDLERIFCRDQVDFESYEYEENRLSSVRRGRFAEFNLNQTTGETNASGPGWLTHWGRGSGLGAGLGRSSSATTNQPVRSDDPKWEYSRIDFDGRMEGNARQKFTTFYDRVRIVYGPVEKPLSVIDGDELTAGAGTMRADSLTVSHHPEDGDQEAWIDLLAGGNAELEGHTEGKNNGDDEIFRARADHISFDQSKGLYMLRSLGSRKATIWRKKDFNAIANRATAQRWEFIPSRNWLKSDRTTGLEGIE